MHISPSLRILIMTTHLVIHAQMLWVKGFAKRQLLRMSGKDTFTYFPLILCHFFGFYLILQVLLLDEYSTTSAPQKF